MIELRNASKEVLEAGSKVYILKNMDLTVAKGEFISIMGPSGSGKSTLMNILGTLDESSSGVYLFEGMDIRRLSGSRLADFRNRRIGFVFQTFMLIPRLSVKENLEVPLLYGSLSGKERRAKLQTALEHVGMLHKLKEPIVNLSGGEKQKVAIARAIINEPDLLLADEPSGNLDSDSKEDILSIFQSLSERGKTIVLVTHDPEVAGIAKRKLTMKNGQWSAPESAIKGGAGL